MVFDCLFKCILIYFLVYEGLSWWKKIIEMWGLMKWIWGGIFGGKVEFWCIFGDFVVIVIVVEEK